MALNWGNGVSGAASGASIGSMGGGYGAIAGGVIGGAIGLFSGGKKKKKKLKPMSTLDPQQQQLYNDYIQGLRGQGEFAGLNNFDTEGYNNVFDQSIAKPAYRGFQENIVPGITGQFRGNNIMNSSYTGEALSRAGRDVQEQLNALRSQNVFQGQQQANINKQNGINNILNMHTFDMPRPQERKQSSIDQILGQIAPFAGQMAGNYFANSGSGSSGGMGGMNTNQGNVLNASYGG